jgi:ABC-2 type transport system ATP-binding protein
VTTVLHQPELLIFDEPFTGFDPINTNLIKKEIKRLSEEGATVIFSTHRMESVEEICDHIGLINNGQVMVEGPLLDIRKNYQNGTYSFITKTAVPQWEDAVVMSQSTHHMGHAYTIQSTTYPGKLVSALAEAGNLVSFEEVLPSVQDIFIEVVENGPKTNQHA